MALHIGKIPVLVTSFLPQDQLKQWNLQQQRSQIYLPLLGQRFKTWYRTTGIRQICPSIILFVWGGAIYKLSIQLCISKV
jgi:hypothetical protein